jgi:hypothetical protein
MALNMEVEEDAAWGADGDGSEANLAADVDGVVKSFLKMLR